MSKSKKSKRNKKRNPAQKMSYKFNYPEKLKLAIDDMCENWDFTSVMEYFNETELTEKELIPVVGRFIEEIVKLIRDNNHDTIMDYLVEDYEGHNFPRISSVFRSYYKYCNDKLVRQITDKLTERFNKEFFKSEILGIIIIPKAS